MSLNGNVTCSQCENLRNGCCDPASEALRNLGYPGTTVRPAPSADASKCLDFEWNMELLIDAEADRIVDDAVKALERAKGFRPHPEARKVV